MIEWSPSLVLTRAITDCNRLKRYAHYAVHVATMLAAEPHMAQTGS